MKVEYELSKKDVIDFNIYHAKNSDVFKKSWFLQKYIIPIIFILASFMIARIIDVPLLYSIITFSILAVLWVVFYPKFFISEMMTRISKLLDEGKNVDLLGKHIVTVNEEGLIEKLENTESIVKWSGVEKIVSTDSHYYIYLSSISACIIPKRAFEDESVEEKFYEFVSTMINESRME